MSAVLCAAHFGYWHLADKRTLALNDRNWTNNGQRLPAGGEAMASLFSTRALPQKIDGERGDRQQDDAERR
jgi:hypothetical protein